MHEDMKKLVAMSLASASCGTFCIALLSEELATLADDGFIGHGPNLARRGGGRITSPRVFGLGQFVVRPDGVPLSLWAG